jgi:hypothetical protein
MRTYVTIFTLFVLSRAASGIANGLHYADRGTTAAVGLLLLLSAGLCIYVIAHRGAHMYGWRLTLCLIGSGAVLASLILLNVSLNNPAWVFSDIHIWTFTTQTALAATVFFAYCEGLRSRETEVIFCVLALAVFPSQFLQKLAVNLIPGNAWNYWATDNPTGETWGSRLFPWLQVPRLPNMETLAFLAALSVALMAFYALYKSKRI